MADHTTDPRTAIRDVLLADVPAWADRQLVDGIEECSISATEAAIDNRHPLAWFDEYGVRL